MALLCSTGKCAGGGLLREPDRVDRILGELRSAITTKFTVKTRIGFATADEFDRLLPIFARHSLDALTVHGRTVAQGYRLPVDYGRIRQAVGAMPCPVIANGHVYSAAQAADVLAQTGARGDALVDGLDAGGREERPVVRRAASRRLRKTCDDHHAQPT